MTLEYITTIGFHSVELLLFVKPVEWIRINLLFTEFKKKNLIEMKTSFSRVKLLLTKPESTKAGYNAIKTL